MQDGFVLEKGFALNDQVGLVIFDPIAVGYSSWSDFKTRATADFPGLVFFDEGAKRATFNFNKVPQG